MFHPLDIPQRIDAHFRMILDKAAAIADPDPARLRYREAIIAIVAGIVRGQQVPSEAAVRAVAAPLIPPRDLDRVTAMALDDLMGLHEGNVSRYRLRLSEYRVWQPIRQAGATFEPDPD